MRSTSFLRFSFANKNNKELKKIFSLFNLSGLKYETSKKVGDRTSRHIFSTYKGLSEDLLTKICYTDLRDTEQDFF